MKNPGRPKEAHSWLQLGEAYIPESGDLGQAGRRTVLQAALTLLGTQSPRLGTVALVLCLGQV